MRRLILFMAALIVPFQISWAAVSAYCLHEGDRDSTHFGHHQCRDTADSKHESPKQKGPAHEDCGTCHTHVTPLVAHLEPIMLPHEASSPELSGDADALWFPLDPPERPDRLRLA